MRYFIFGSVVLTMLCACEVGAAAVLYTDRTSWETAVGPLSGTEDFNSFTVDTSFQGTSVGLNGMTVIGTTGSNGADSQKIDVLPPGFSGIYDIDNTDYLLGDLEGSSEYIRFDFTNPVSAWGADTRGISNGSSRNTVIDFYDSSNLLVGSVSTSTASNSDFGFYGIDIGGQTASYAIVHNTLGDNDVFGVDNIAYVTGVIPEPSSFLAWSGLLGMGLVGGWWRRRKK